MQTAVRNTSKSRTSTTVLVLLRTREGQSGHASVMLEAYWYREFTYLRIPAHAEKNSSMQLDGTNTANRRSTSGPPTAAVTPQERSVATLYSSTRG